MAQLHNSKSFKSIISVTLITAALGLSACSGPTNPDVKARQDIMKSYGDAMGVMGDMVKAPDTFDAAIFQEQAAFLSAESANPWSHFEDKEAIGEATEAVWTNVDDFRAESEKFQQVTAELDTVAQMATSVADIQPAFGAVGKSCKSCHTDFQVKKDD
jgi:cytochrome c556